MKGEELGADGKGPLGSTGELHAVGSCPGSRILGQGEAQADLHCRRDKLEGQKSESRKPVFKPLKTLSSSPLNSYHTNYLWNYFKHLIIHCHSLLFNMHVFFCRTIPVKL